MKPAQSFLFLFLTGGTLILGQALIPGSFRPLGYSPKLFKIKDWLSEGPTSAPPAIARNLAALQAKTEELAQSDTAENDTIAFGKEQVPDTSGHLITDIPEFALDSSSGIQYPAGDTTILYPFFAALDSIPKTKELIRILHFGDSQIEGDRISGYLRQRFQQKYGGCGPGLVPLAEETQGRFAIESRTDRLPERYILYGKPRYAPHARYSLLHTLFRLRADTSKPEQSVVQNFYYRLRNIGFKKATYFQKASLLCHNASSPVDITAKLPRIEPLKRTLFQSDSFHTPTFILPEKRTQIQFQVASSPQNDFYGVCLDCPQGIAIDNIPLRGSSGLEFSRINAGFLRQQIRELNVKLIILEFGVNVVPYEAKKYGWYETALVKTIQSLKKAAPRVQVLVIGVSDMARRAEGKWLSYPTLEMVKTAQRNAARRTNSAFWDLHQVMGGQNSIVAWANTSPPLAGKDFIHLTPKGAQVVAEFFYQAIEQEYMKTRRKINI